MRKTAPKIETPFKCYIYETRGFERVGNDNLNCVIGGSGRGIVIGEFVCDEIKRIDIPYPAYWHELDASVIDSVLGGTCLSLAQIHDYLGHRSGYGWHISDLVIYDKPNALSEFKRWNRAEENSPCAHMKWLYEPCETCPECNLKRPPQSYCYVEELDNT